MLLSINNLLTVIGISLSIFMTIVLLNRPSLGKTNIYLIGLIGALVLSQTFSILFSTDLYLTTPFLIKTYIPPQFLIGPFLYFYIASLTDDTFTFGRNKLIHFVPFIVSLVYLLPFFMLPADKKILFVKEHVSPTVPSTMEECAVWGLFQISLGYYIFRAYWLFLRHQKKLKGMLSSYNRNTLGWINFFMFAAALFLIFFLLIDIFMVLGYPLAFFNDIITGAINIAILVMSCFAIIKIEYVIVSQNSVLEKGTPKNPLPGDSTLQTQFDHILSDVTAKEYYLKPDITLPELAAKTGMTRNELSRIINRGGRTTFYDFINKMRVERAKDLLLSPQEIRMSILDIAYSCGFNSKSAFHTAFKKWKGMTPLELRKVAERSRKYT